jgi:gamma-glutamyl phosphate reductase
MADALEKNADAIKQANALDMEFGASHGLSAGHAGPAQAG